MEREGSQTLGVLCSNQYNKDAHCPMATCPLPSPALPNSFVLLLK